MAAIEALLDRVKSLSPEEQRFVDHFIDYLEQKAAPARSPFLEAAGDFVARHPELLRRLAQ